MYMANIKKWNNHGFQVTGQVVKVTKVMINFVK
jgi:hypothetical protein